MRKFLFVLLISHIALSQKPGVFISKSGFWKRLIGHRIILPSGVRTGILYQVPPGIYPSYRHALERQILGARIEPLQLLLPTEQEIFTSVEAFGILDEDRHNPAAILALIPSIQGLIDFAIVTSEPHLSSIILRPGMRHMLIKALGVRANLHVEAAGAMREQAYEQRFIDEQLGEAYRVMGMQLQQLAIALEVGEDVADMIQIVMEERDSLGYTPPPAPPRRRFWEGFRPFWGRGSL